MIFYYITTLKFTYSLTSMSIMKNSRYKISKFYSFFKEKSFFRLLLKFSRQTNFSTFWMLLISPLIIIRLESTLTMSWILKFLTVFSMEWRAFWSVKLTWSLYSNYLLSSSFWVRLKWVGYGKFPIKSTQAIPQSSQKYQWKRLGLFRDNWQFKRPKERKMPRKVQIPRSVLQPWIECRLRRLQSPCKQSGSKHLLE